MHNNLNQQRNKMQEVSYRIKTLEKDHILFICLSKERHFIDKCIQ